MALGTGGAHFFADLTTMENSQLGPYRIGRRLGRGGMGTVYAAVEVETGTAAAVKILSPALAGEEGFRERFEGEIESLKKLRHPNIVRLLGWGEQDGHLFYAMELVEGSTLDQELRNGRKFHWREVAEIGIHLCRALKHAHDRGVIHRDIKPANLLLAPDGTLKLSDFGIAKLFGTTGLTVDGGVIGTAEYMSPEQADGRAVTDRCDLYSVGGVLYALLAGRAPFKARTLPEMLQLQRFAAPEPVRRYAPDTPAEFEQIVQQLLEKETDRRIPSAMVLSRRLETMLRGLSVREERDTGEGGDVDLMAETAVEEEPSAVVVDDGDYSTAATRELPGGTGRVVEDTGRSRLPEPTSATQAAPERSPATGGGAGVTGATAPMSDVMPVDTYGFQLAAPAADTSDVPVAPPPKPPARYTVAPQREDLELSDEDEESRRTRWIQAALLATALVGMGALVWYLSRPPSSDALYDRVTRAVDDENPERLLDVEGDLESFLQRFPDDPRCDELEDYRAILADYRAETISRNLTRRLARKPKLMPVERAYLDAVHDAIRAPEAAVARLQAFLTLFRNQPGISRDGQRCVDAAERKLAQLQVLVAESATAHEEFLASELRRAQSAWEADPEGARAIWRAIIELYAQQPWAAPSVAEARARLAAGDAGAESKASSAATP